MQIWIRFLLGVMSIRVFGHRKFTFSNRRWPIFRLRVCQCSTKATTSRPDKGPRPSVYDSTYVESRWYDWWEKSDQFKIGSKSQSEKKPFSICFPPPNVTGDLHIGHALTVAVEDVLLRWHRMKGEQVSWVPGYDHAGIATQVVVEKQIMRQRRVRRVDMDREDFVAECFRWKEKKIGNIQMQLKRLGASLDWSRTYYTMDENFSTAVTEAFLQLYRRGLVFRGERLVNWCPFLKSTLSDVEVDKVSFNGDNENEFKLRLPGRSEPIVVGRLFFIKYPLANDSGEFLSVATTRLETIAADAALAVHPNDQRYAKYVGQFARNPLSISADPIVIVADSKVDPNFGTGVLKVTPAHDWTDFEIGVRHGLSLTVQCLDENGKLNERCDVELRGLDRFDARDKILDILSSRGLVVGVQKRSQCVLPLCTRTGDIVEPMLKLQWFLNCRNMAAAASRAVEDGTLKITPKFHEAQWKHWLSLTGDWCISRQLWWGHRIPAYQLRETGRWYCGKNASEAFELAKKDNPSSEIGLGDLVQDEDVLDTWFSSALVPLVASGWPKNKENHYYPLSLMETGHDILSFWVTRMAMMGLELTNRLPFDEILLHGIVFDKRGRKMSKSLGNVVDPLDIIDGVDLSSLKNRLDASSLPSSEIEIAKNAMTKEFPEGVLKCGADALRFTLLKQDVKFPQLNLDVNLMLSGRKFCNKIWQAFTFMENCWAICAADGWKCEGHAERIKKNFENLPVVDQWILSRLTKTVDTVNVGMQNYDLHFGVTALYDFAWFELCDFYLEWTKSFLKPNTRGDFDSENAAERKRSIGDILFLVADVYTRCSAPFMPFLAEESFGRLIDVRRNRSSESNDEWSTASVHKCPFPQSDQFPYANDDLEKRMAVSRKILEAVRSLRNEFGLSFRDQLTCTLFGDSFSLDSARTFDDFLKLVGKISTKEYRSIESSMSDLSFGHIWKSVDENLLLAAELQQADHGKVSNRLSAQIDRLKKRKGDHETRRQKIERVLKNEVRAWGEPTKIEEEMKSVQQKILNVETELGRLERMYQSFSKS